MTLTCPCGSPLQSEVVIQTGRCKGCRSMADNFSPRSWIDYMFVDRRGRDNGA
jgi:sarcosine oxidase delta subunit